MPKLPIVIAILCLIPLCSAAWSGQNLLDFATYTYNLSDCRNESIDIPKILSEENQTTVGYGMVQLYERMGDCESFVRGQYHWLQLNYPTSTCPDRFNQRVHEWFDDWNWAFTDCGLDYTKADLNSSLTYYRKMFFLANLSEPVAATQPQDYNGNFTYVPQADPQTTPIGGGGGFDFNIGKHSMFATWILLPNVIWFEVILLILSYWVGGMIWGRESYKQGMYFDTNSPIKNFGMSITNRLKLLFIIFIVLNIVWWAVFFFVL